MGWVRFGKCHQCGNCCQIKNLLQAACHVQTTVSDTDAVCRHLSFDETSGLAICLVFNKKERPEACSLHPGSPKSLTSEECGYFFIFTDS
jgi:hypothetical protein